MPHPHRQSSLVLHDSVFDPLDVDALFQIYGPASDEAQPTPLSLLPRPHARARTQSLDRPACSSTKFDTSSRVPVALPQAPTPLSIPPTDPDFYYEKNPLIQELEQFALSYSYVSSPSSVAPTSTLPKGAAKPATIGGASTAEHKNVVTGNARRVDTSSSSTQGDHGPASFILPQSLLEIYSEMSISSSLEGSRRMSLIDLILHGLLDPSPESISLYRDASLLANKINPSVNGRGNVTLNELLALGVLSGEETGVAHRMPRAWIGGIADIDIENATSECFQFHSLDNGSATIDIERSSSVANSPERPITTSIFATPLLSAVSLHSQTVAVSLREQGGSQPDTLHRDVVDLQHHSENGYKRSVDELVVPGGENSGEPNGVKLSAPKINRAHTTIPVSHISHNTLTSTPSSSELSSQYHSGALKPTHSFIPPGAALPINPHLPNAYSTFPRHSVMFMKPASFAAPYLEQSTGASIEPGAESHTDSIDSFLETDNDVEEVTDMNNEESEHMSGSSISSNPNLDGAVPLPSLSSPLLGSAHSSISGTIATSYIFSDEAEILPSQNHPTVTILAVSHSDETSAIIDPPLPATSLLLDPEQSMVISDVTDMLISDSIPQDSPNTSIASQSGIVQGLDLTHAMDTVNLPSRSRYSVHSDCSASPDATALVVDRRRDSKLWIQRSPKSSGLMATLESPRRGYFGGIAAPEERRHSQVSLLEDNIPTASVGDSPSTKGKFSSLPHIRIRRRSTVPKERPSTTHDEEGDGGGSEKKTKRLSRAISWMVTDIDDGPSQKLDVDDMVLEGDQRSKTGSPMKSFFTNLAASASSTSLLSFSDRGRRLSTSDISVQSGFANVDARASRVNPTLDTYPAPSPSAPALVVTPTHSPILSILSLPLNNLSNHSETPPRPALIISDSISSSACSTTSIFPSSVNAGIQQRLLASSSTNLARRHSNGAAPVGPRPSKRGGSLRTTSVVSSNSTKSTPSQSLRSESSSRPLPIPSPLPMSQSELVSTSVSSSGIKEDDAENLITPFPAPVPTDSSNKDSDRRSSTISRPQSRSGPSPSFSPLRKLAIDEVPLRTGIPRIAVAVSKASRPSSVAGVGNIGATNHSSKSKWKFWGNGGGRPVSMTVDLTREI
ncbi:hypothetical protein GGU11DRAFT_566486 [Lentinula aff. detonsa]|nr:hypothetical protein GGU11DRAFT_566486 [Lentinula aff. detonsa]